jgi:hypothetical protein
LNVMALSIISPLHVLQTFENLLNTYRRQDGSRWTSQQMDEATDGLVLRSYVTNLSKVCIESPGYEKMKAISKVKGFPPEAWSGDALGELPEGRSNGGRGIAGRVEHLFGAVRNLKTGELYTNVEVARMTLGDLSEEDLEGIRNGAIGNPTMGQIVALAHAFGVKPSYMLDRGEPVLDAELVEALRDGAVRETAREFSRLPERERRTSAMNPSRHRGPF